MSAAAEQIGAKRFRQGDYWVWLYTDADGKPSSWERYSVRASSAGSELVIDMASKFEEREPYSTHHRMRLKLANNLLARDSREQWCFEEFAFSQGEAWYEAPHRDNVQAFEEKFNVFLMSPVLPAPVRAVRTRGRDLALGGAAAGRATLVQSRRHAYTDAWYIREPRALCGLAAYKEFGGGEGGGYTFELIEVGCAEDTSGAGPLKTDGRGRTPYG